jgi:hypothetical protein
MRLLLVELNEINFDVVKLYVDSGESLPGFELLFKNNLKTTSSEDIYENLEPWIQWPSVHTGKKYEEHGVFRLGDIVNFDHKQIFEKVEEAGFSVGAISPMNAKNSLKKPSYFIPDPWTQTDSDSSFINQGIASAVSQSVNDNSSSRITMKSLFYLFLGFLLNIKFRKKLYLIKYAISALGKPWRKALFLDMFLHEIHLNLFQRNNTNFSTLFLNAGAHIQHHYFFNSKVIKKNNVVNPDWYINKDLDPFYEMILCYDQIIQELLSINDCEIIIATGLSQIPYKKTKFYYRLENHKKFLSKLGIKFKDIYPRMTRDFLITFDNTVDAINANNLLNEIYVDKQVKLFGLIKNRGKELFVTLTYPNEIKDSCLINIGSSKTKLKDEVIFVAIKNGMHCSKGYAFFSKNLESISPANGDHVSNIHETILKAFDISKAC